MSAGLDLLPPGVVERAVSGRVMVLTGAGMSAESGVPTFRDAQTGLWARYDPQDLATPEAFQRQPQLVWEWYAWRRQLALGAIPHDGHRALAALQRRFDVRVVTQNVDRLHQVGGAWNVVELHGSLFSAHCLAGHPAPPAALEAPSPPPCARCGALVRPGVVWFGESLPAGRFEQAGQLAADCGLLLVVGTSGVVYPAAGLPRVARRGGALVVEVNPVPTALEAVDVRVQASAQAFLWALAEACGCGPEILPDGASVIDQQQLPEGLLRAVRRPNGSRPFALRLGVPVGRQGAAARTRAFTSREALLAAFYASAAPLRRWREPPDADHG